MKKIKLLVLFTMLSISQGMSQEGFNYQAILYDTNGDIIRDTTVSIRLTISDQTQPSQGLQSAYVESHSATIGNDGVVNLIIGTGNVIGSKQFNAIDWSDSPLYIQREVDAGQGFQVAGYSKILSVPVAQYSLKSGDSDVMWVRSNTNSETITYDKQVIIGNPDNQLVPPLKVYGTDNGPTSSSMEVFRSSSRNNVIGFTTSGSPTFDNLIQPGETINSSVGILSPGYFDSNGHTFVIGMKKGSNGVWTNPFTIEFGAPTESLSIESDGLVRISGTVSATAFRGDGSELTNLSGISMFDTRSNAIFNEQTSKTPSLVLSPTDDPSTSFNEETGLSANNVMIGNGSGYRLTQGHNNIALGYSSLASVTSSYGNIALGPNTLTELVAFPTANYSYGGVYNIALGWGSLQSLATGSVNIGIGTTSLRYLSEGTHNVAMGAGSLERLTEGDQNTALGGDALNRTMLGSANTAIGYQALRYSNQTGVVTATLGDFSYQASIDNTAVGKNAMINNVVGSYNAAFGTSALSNNDKGFNNTAIGLFTLQNNGDGVDNTALGWGSLMNSENSSGNTAVGGHAGQYLANNSGGNTFIGNYSGVSESSSATIIENSIAIGAYATVTTSNTIQLGNDNVTLVNTTGTVSATAFRGDGSELTNLSGISMFDTRSNAIFNEQTSKTPSLVLSPTDDPSTSFNEETGLSANNVMIGNGSGYRLTQGHNNIALGYSSLASVTSSYGNIALGPNTLTELVAFPTANYSYGGVYNIALGWGSLQSLATGSVNIGIGTTSLRYLSEGTHNVAMGAGSLERLTEGDQNTALGGDALNRTMLGSANTAIGYQALRYSNQTGVVTATLGDFSYQASIDNTAVGKNAMINNVVGSYNAAFGTSALSNNDKGFNNTAIGLFTLQNNGDGVDNTALGWGSLMNSENSSGNTAVGGHAGQYLANNSGGNTFIGNYSGVSESSSATIIENSTALGADATVTTSNTMVFGNENVNFWSFGRTSNEIGKAFQVGDDSTNGNGAYLTSGGVWTNASSIDFKTDIKRLSSSDLLSSINQLLVAKWRYKDTNEYHIGPFAEQFKKIFSLGVEDDDKHISTMDIAGVSIIGIQELTSLVSELQSENKELTQEINELKSRLTEMEEKLDFLFKQNR